MSGFFDSLTDWFDGATTSVGGAYDAASRALSDAMTTISTTTQSWSAEWQAAVDNLKNKAREFAQVFARLEADAPNVPASQKATYDSLMKKGRWIREQIKTLTSGIDFGWSLIGSNPAALNGLGMLAGRGGLGVLPLVPIAAIIGGVAVITAWLADAYVMIRKIDAAKASGGTAAEQAAIINAGQSGGVIAQVGSFAKSATIFLLIGGAIYIFAPQIKKAFRL